MDADGNAWLGKIIMDYQLKCYKKLALTNPSYIFITSIILKLQKMMGQAIIRVIK